MTIEKFLSFWSQHNTVIIEGLVGLIILFSLFLAYRTLFAKKDAKASFDNEAGLDVVQLEKTLQRLLENQGAPAKTSPASSDSEDLDINVGLDDADAEKAAAKAKKISAGTEVSEEEALEGAAPESAAEVAQLRLTLSESYERVQALQAEVEALKTSVSEKEAEVAAAAAGGTSSEEGGGGLSAAEKEQLQGKVADLEARLSEYEIISEDIADLSRYRDENEELKKQIEQLKTNPGQGESVASAAEPEVTASEPETPEVAASETVAVEAAEIEVSEPIAIESEVQAESAPAEVAAEAPSEENSDLIDDDLMKEFAAAVAGQKASSTAPPEGEEPAKKTGETDDLMNEFENFVAKKS